MLLSRCAQQVQQLDSTPTPVTLGRRSYDRLSRCMSRRSETASSSKWWRKAVCVSRMRPLLVLLIFVESARLVLVGDVHHQWSERDAQALRFLEPDVALFVGDFGEEVVDLVKSIKSQTDSCSISAAYILGNHDAWHSLSKKQLSGCGDALLSGVQEQLRILGDDHVGYSSKQFPNVGISVVGARPFSAGGSSWARAARFQHIMYGINSMEESANKICTTIQEQPEEHAVVVMAHNGPNGFGSEQHDICGKDWSDKAGDHGDPDLASALKQASAVGRPVPLVVFGHMHHMLKGGKRRRNMVHIDADSGTVLLNCAVVPRWGANHDSPNALRSQFTVVQMAADGYVESASFVWVETHGSQCCVVSEQEIIRTHSCIENKLNRQFCVTGQPSGAGNDEPIWKDVVSVLP